MKQPTDKTRCERGTCNHAGHCEQCGRPHSAAYIAEHGGPEAYVGLCDDCWRKASAAARPVLKCESCGKPDTAVEIGDFGEHGILCEKCAEQIVPKSFLDA